MPAKIRLQRHGRKRYAYYHIVVADSRAPRDGRFIERIGSYNPNTNPATIDLDFDKALSWLNNGAQPTDTVRTILSHQGVLYMKHLLGGVTKGAFSQEEAEKRFSAWKTGKDARIQSSMDKLSTAAESAKNTRFEAERKIKEERTQALIKKGQAEAAAKVAEEAAEAVVEATEEIVETVEAVVETAETPEVAEDTATETPETEN